MVTVKEQAALSPFSFIATHSTLFFPIGNSDRDGGVHVTVRSLPLMSDGSFHSTITVDLPGSVDSSRSTGQTGSRAVKKYKYDS